MLNLLTLFKNHFDTGRVSDDNLKKFAQDHIERLVANNVNGQYSAMHQATLLAYNDYYGAISSEDIHFAVQQSRTKRVDMIIEEFKKSVSQKEGAVRAQYGTDSPEYQEFFPLGLTEYSQAIKANIETLMLRLVAGFTAYQSTLGNGLLAQFKDIHTRYMIARQEQLQQIGTVDADKSKTADTRSVLEVQLMKNILVLAAEYIGMPERGNDFFDQSIIRSETDADNGWEKGEVAPNTTMNIESQGIKENTTFKLHNAGTIDLIFSLAADAQSVHPNGLRLQPDKWVSVRSADLGDAENTFLNVTNPDSQTIGAWEVLIL